MLFLANTEQTQFGRSPEEKRDVKYEGQQLRQVLRRARKEPNGDFVVQRLETFIRDLSRRGDKSSVSIFLSAFWSPAGELRCNFANSRFRSENSTVGLSELYEVLSNSGIESSYVFLAIDQDSLDNIRITRANDVFLLLVTKRWSKLAALLASEITLWEGINSLDGGHVTHSRVAKAAEVMARRLIAYSDGLIKPNEYLLFNSIEKQSEAWQVKASRSIGINENKLLHGRGEQRLDELNRLAQAGADRDYSPQASFWLSELNENHLSLYPDLVKRFLIYGEVFGELIPSFIYAEQYRNKRDPGLEWLREFAATFLPIPEGNFLMGETSPDEDSEPPASPQHSVWLDGYTIMKTTLTNRQLSELVSEWTYDSYKSLHPAVFVSFLEAAEIASHLTALMQAYGIINQEQIVNIPSEAQWEKAARGTDGRQHPWGNIFSNKVCNVMTTGIGSTTIVASFSPLGDSPYGCSDMIGNVREWTSTFAGRSIRNDNRYPYDPNQRISTHAMRPEFQMILRGGSFSYDDNCTMVWIRNKEVASQKRHDTGVRFTIENKNNRY